MRRRMRERDMRTRTLSPGAWPGELFVDALLLDFFTFFINRPFRRLGKPNVSGASGQDEDAASFKINFSGVSSTGDGVP